MRQSIARDGKDAWITVWDDWHMDERNGGRFAAFAEPSRREQTLLSAAWDLSKGSGGPGFSVHYEDGQPVPEYFRYSTEDVYPIILRTETNGLEEDNMFLSEEFRIVMELWEDRKTGNYYSFDDDGTRQPAVEFSESKIRIRTPILRRYQAARQLDLLLFTDSVQYVDWSGSSEDFDHLTEQDHVVDGDTVAFFVVGGEWQGDQVFSRLLVTRVLTPPPQEKSGIWPWDKDSDENFPDFVIGEDDLGQPVRFTCAPDSLANYFGANSDAPHYLTPVFFRAEVLDRYYRDPERYRITDGRLYCGHLWGVQIDNGKPDVVMVFLGDLGRDLPASHRDYWRSFNIPPTQSMSESAFRRSFLAQFADSENPGHAFANAYLAAQKSWIERRDWPLFRTPAGSDERLLQRVHVPASENDEEFEEQILVICKLLVDLLNETEIGRRVEKVEGDAGISKFKRFLAANGYAHVERDIALLRTVQRLRSKGAAHSKGATYAATLARELDGLTHTKFISSVLSRATTMLTDLSQLPPANPTSPEK